MPDRNVQWIIGALIAIVVPAAVALGTQISGLREDVRGNRIAIDNVRAELHTAIDNVRLELRAEIRAFDDRLRAVEIDVGKLQQQSVTINRQILTINQQLLTINQRLLTIERHLLDPEPATADAPE